MLNKSLPAIAGMVLSSTFAYQLGKVAVDGENPVEATQPGPDLLTMGVFLANAPVTPVPLELIFADWAQQPIEQKAANMTLVEDFLTYEDFQTALDGYAPYTVDTVFRNAYDELGESTGQFEKIDLVIRDHKGTLVTMARLRQAVEEEGAIYVFTPALTGLANSLMTDTADLITDRALGVADGESASDRLKATLEMISFAPFGAMMPRAFGVSESQYMASLLADSVTPNLLHNGLIPNMEGTVQPRTINWLTSDSVEVPDGDAYVWSEDQGDGTQHIFISLVSPTLAIQKPRDLLDTMWRNEPGSVPNSFNFLVHLGDPAGVSNEATSVEAKVLDGFLSTAVSTKLGVAVEYSHWTTGDEDAYVIVPNDQSILMHTGVDYQGT
jgi:hypothetical protein